jgi:AcrR family transcriptional regulator
MTDLDRRVRRTRRTLAEALIALILERGYERITVQDILDRADVGRSTFYAHFRDKEALLLACFDDVRDQLRSELGEAAPGTAPADLARPAEVLYRHAHRHRRIYRALCGRTGGQLVYRHLHGLVGDLWRDAVRAHVPADPDLPAEVVAEFYTSAALGLLLWWIGEDFPHDPTWLAAAYRRLALPGAPAV